MNKKRYEEIEKLVQDMKDDYSKFYDKDNKAAGTRLRGMLQKMKVLSQEMRKEIQERKNSSSKA